VKIYRYRCGHFIGSLVVHETCSKCPLRNPFNPFSLKVRSFYEMDDLCLIRNAVIPLDGATGWPTVFVHGALGIGDFSNHHQTCKVLGLRDIAPTLPGWDASTAWPGYTLLDWPLDLLELLGNLGVLPSDTMRTIL